MVLPEAGEGVEKIHKFVFFVLKVENKIMGKRVFLGDDELKMG